MAKIRFDKFLRTTAKSDINLEKSSHMETVVMLSREPGEEDKV